MNSRRHRGTVHKSGSIGRGLTADVTVAVARAAFWAGGAISGVRCACPSVDGGVGRDRRGEEVDSVLESWPRLAVDRASAEAWLVKSESSAMNDPQSDWCEAKKV